MWHAHIILLDFGACRHFSQKFTDQYLTIIKAAADKDKRKIKFLLLKDREESIAKKSNSISNGAEKHDSDIDHNRSNNTENVGVQMINYTARWNNEKTNVLDNVNLTIEPGQLVLIVGPVGAGKSSILYSLCGECNTVSGTIKTNGKIVYVPQDPWIFSASVRQNIIFGRQRLEPQRYAKVVEVCQMEKDLESLARGDSTVVGDRGAALSGGQKARINLARALYYDADIYLLDDPLSAVDAAVGRLLFERCINSYLRDKIRILVTHQLQYLKHADYVIVMKDGKVAASGKYQDLEKLGEKFTSILRETEESYQKSGEKLARLSSNRELNRTISQESARLPDRTQIKKVPHRSTSEDANSTAETVIGARDDSVFSDSSPKLNQTIEKDALLQEQDNLDWKREVQAQFEDEKSSGVVNWRVYVAYFRHMGSCACVVLAFAFCVFVQITYYFSRVNSEDAKKMRIFNQTFGSEFNMDRINASLDTICSLSPTKVEKNLLPDMFKTLGTYDYLYIYTIIIIGLTIGSLLRSVAFRIMLNRSSFVLHSKMFSAILKAPLLFFDRNPIGRILNRFSKDTGTMDELLSFATFDFIQMKGLDFGEILPILKGKSDDTLAKSPVYSHVSATLNGITSIRSFGVEKFVMKDFHRHQNSHTSIYSAFLSTSRWFSLVIDWLCSIFVCIVAFMCIWSAVVEGRITEGAAKKEKRKCEVGDISGQTMKKEEVDSPRLIHYFIRSKLAPLLYRRNQSAGSIGLTLFYAVSLLGFFQWIVRQSTEMESMVGNAGEVGLSVFYASSLMILFSRFLSQTVNVEHGMVSVERVLEYANLKPEDESTLIIKPPKDWPKRGQIKFDEVKLRYSMESDYILKNLSFEIKPAEKLMIDRRSVSGKCGKFTDFQPPSRRKVVKSGCSSTKTRSSHPWRETRKTKNDSTIEK
uniref:Uncharacterized protein n=1 Tax=Romanomermis culicivorax TaxID=13658 RepID=A0A915IRS2_ROMCU